MRKISALLVATALTVAPAGIVFAQSNTSGKTVLGVSTGVDKEGKATSETTTTGRGKIDPTGTPTGSNANSGRGTVESNAIGRGNVDPTGKPAGANISGSATMGGSTGGTIGRGHVDPTGKATGRNTQGSVSTSSSASTTMGSPTRSDARSTTSAEMRSSTYKPVRLSRSKLEAYEQAKVAALNMPQNTPAERDARAAAIARADAMRM